ncbi:hypothetical protein [Ramlibacter tataouinensis]|uniref:DUF2783 domain-containing protein n=1 Tax=Ramlibacter tataouinensis (strain ATCC BAA-407 / DSM 14655 / LMG 21543 / TTB310) TaxID=365046 RepID=F5Y3V9_RAMTT|nr:hypothetical protein [Ramlibacter tataouinensis]AEG91237.1 Hypothetical protein Rta_01730 [Ramlibacter tataouinensis TTB310]
MPTTDLDAVYTALAQAVQAAGPRSELFLAMLSLRLVARLQDAPVAMDAIRQTIDELAAHGDIATPATATSLPDNP